jgi:hypothetical protein
MALPLLPVPESLRRVTVVVELESESLDLDPVGTRPVGRGVRGTTVWVEVVDRDDEDEDERAGEGVREGDEGEGV